MVNKFANKRNHSDWKVKGKPSERNFMQNEYFRSSGSKDSILISTDLTTDLPFDEIDDMLKKEDEWKTYDKQIGEVNELKVLTPFSRIIYRQNAGNFLIPARDYVLSVARLELKDGTIAHTFFTVETGEAERDGVVRGTILVSTF